MKKGLFLKISSLVISVTMIGPFTSVNAQGEYEDVELIYNGSFEDYGSEGFPQGWSSNGENILLGGDFESGQAALESVGTSPSGSNLRWASPVTGTNGVEIVESSDDEKQGHGNYYTKMEFIKSSWGGVGYPTVPNPNYLINAAYGASYLFKADYKVSSTAAFNRANIGAFYLLTCADNPVKNETQFERIITDSETLPQTTWQKYSQIITLENKPEGTGEYYDFPHVERLQFRYSSSPAIADGESASLFVDNLRMEKLGRSSDEWSSRGSRSLKIVGYADGVNEVWESDSVSVYSGEKIDISAKILPDTLESYTIDSDNYTGKVSVTAVFDDGSEVVVGEIADKSQEYISISEVISVPETASHMQIRIDFSGSGIVYVDEVSAVAQREVQQIVVPENYENILVNGGFEDYDDKGFPVNWDSAGKNLLVNGDFENASTDCGIDAAGNGALRYTNFGGVAKDGLSVADNSESDYNRYGMYSLRMQWSKVQWGGAGLQNDTDGILKLSYGNDYILRASVKAENEDDFITSSHRFQFNVITNYNPKDSVMGQNSWIPNTNWQEFACTFSVPQKEAEYPEYALARRFQTRTYSANSETAAMYVDNISIEKTSRTDISEKHSGERSLMINGYADNDGEDEVWQSQEVGVVGGEKVYFGLSYKKDNITDGAGARLVFTDNSGREIRSRNIDLGAGSGAWNNKIIAETVPEQAQGAFVEVYVSEGAGTLWADDIFLSALPEEEHINVNIPDGIYNVIENNGFENVDDKDFPYSWESDGKNLIENGDFEEESYWYAAGATAGGTREFEYSSDSPDGTISGNLKWTTDPVTGIEEWGCIAQREGNGVPTMTPIAVALDSQYIVRMDTKIEGNIKNNNVTVMSELKNGANAWNIQTLLSASATGEWKNYTSLYTTPAASEEKNGNNPDVAMGYINYIYAGRAVGIAIENGMTQLWIDNLSLEKLGRTDAEENASGTKSLKIVGYNDGKDEIWESDSVLSVEAGEEIYFGGMVKTENIRNYAGFEVRFYDENNVYVSSKEFSTGRGTKDWAEYTDSAIVPETAAFAKLILKVGDGSGTAWFDDVILGKMVSGIYSTKPIFNFDELAVNAGEELTATTEVYNYAEPKNISLFLAIYDENGMIAADISSADVSKDGSKLSASVTIPQAEYAELAKYTAKAFVWETAGNIPIRDSEILPGSKTDGDIVMSSLYSDNMVLQQGEAIKVLGEATEGAVIEVSLASNTQTVTVDSDGRWSVTFPQMSAGGPYSLIVKDNRGHKKVFENIMVGEVWLVSGQSNVQNTTSYFDGLEQYTQDNEMIRLFSVPRTQSDERVDQLSSGEWKECTVATSSGFSAVGYLLAKELSENMPGVAIGIVESSFAGSDIGEWLDEESSVLVNVTTSPEKRAKRYNGMIYPIRNYNYAGVVWYQGESSRNWLYQTWLETMVKSWRNTFAATELDFVIVQLPRFEQDGFAIVREAQRLAAKDDENMYLSVNIDLGELDNVHPSDKAELVDRLSNVILREVYEKDVDCYGPTLKDVRFEGNMAIVEFNNAQGLKTTDGQTPREFIIAGEDGVFMPADAVINGGNVELTCDEISQPCYVRYAFEGYPEPNLVNGIGLPAEPFRTDSINTVYPFAE